MSKSDQGVGLENKEEEIESPENLAMLRQRKMVTILYEIIVKFSYIWCALIGTIRAATGKATTKTRDVKETQCSLSQKNEDHLTVSRRGDHNW